MLRAAEGRDVLRRRRHLGAASAAAPTTAAAAAKGHPLPADAVALARDPHRGLAVFVLAVRTERRLEELRSALGMGRGHHQVEGHDWGERRQATEALAADEERDVLGREHLVRDRGG